MTIKYMPKQNNLLGALPAEDYEHILPHLELISLPFNGVIYETGCELHYAYFPINCIVSKFYITQNGSSSEIAMVGNEGVIGTSLFMGGKSMMDSAVVRSAGYAYRIRAHLFLHELNRFGELRNGALKLLLFRYTQALLTQIAQTAVCNRFHSVDQQLCRWLLHSLDRLNSNEILITQEIISNMLGVRRESITEAARKLQYAGLINYQRGHITVLNRAGLEKQVCECYPVVKAEFERLLPCSESLNLNAPYRKSLFENKQPRHQSSRFGS
jgi:CRP-like cAMP-binding protein